MLLCVACFSRGTVGSSTQNCNQESLFCCWFCSSLVLHSYCGALDNEHSQAKSPSDYFTCVFLYNEIPLITWGEIGHFQTNKRSGFPVPPRGPSLLFIFIDPLCFSHLIYNLTITTNCTFNCLQHMKAKYWDKKYIKSHCNF